MCWLSNAKERIFSSSSLAGYNALDGKKCLVLSSRHRLSELVAATLFACFVKNYIPIGNYLPWFTFVKPKLSDSISVDQGCHASCDCNQSSKPWMFQSTLYFSLRWSVNFSLMHLQSTYSFQNMNVQLAVTRHILFLFVPFEWLLVVNVIF